MEFNVGTEFRPRKKKRSNGLIKFLLMLFIASVISLGIIYYLHYLEQKPNMEKVTPYQGITNPTWIDGQLWQGTPVKIENGEVYLPFSLIKSEIDPAIFWDESVQSVLITTKDKVLRFPNQQLQAFINEKPFQLTMPVLKAEDEIYIPYEPLKKLYPIEITYYENYQVTVIDHQGTAIQEGKVIKQEEEERQVRAIRSGSSIKEPILQEIAAGDTVRILDEQDGWYRVLSSTGIVGFMEKAHVALGTITILDKHIEQKEYTPWNPVGEKINLTWEHVVSKNPDTSNIPALKGLNVISPTWFEIADENGTILNKADARYVKWAHQRGYQVWALISNGFNPDRTHQFLSDYHTRQSIIRQMIEFAHLYDLDGFNIDFENVYLKDKELLVQFIRELTPYLHEQDLVVSIDVTVKSTSENWSMFYDRKAIGEVVDYMMVMAYDEHPAGSSKAGSVASLPWVEKGLQGILEEVPAHKVLLGVPYYTRLWTESKDSSGKIKVTQKAYSMPAIKKWLAERGVTPVYDETTGQNYVEYVDQKEGLTYKIWLEDEQSMKKRAELVKKYNLAGIASWRRGFESEEIWQVILDTLSKRP